MWASWIVPKLSRGAEDLAPTLDAVQGCCFRQGLVPWTYWLFVGNSMSGDFSEPVLRFSLIQSEFGPHALIALSPNSKPKLSKQGNLLICFPSNNFSWLKLNCCHNQTPFPLTCCTLKKKKNLVIWINFLLNYHRRLMKGGIYRYVQLQAESTPAKHTSDKMHPAICSSSLPRSLPDHLFPSSGHLNFPVASSLSKPAVLLKDWIFFPAGSQQTRDRTARSMATPHGSGHRPSAGYHRTSISISEDAHRHQQFSSHPGLEGKACETKSSPAFPWYFQFLRFTQLHS